MSTVSSLTQGKSLLLMQASDSTRIPVATDGDASQSAGPASPSTIVTIPSAKSVDSHSTYSLKDMLGASGQTVNWASISFDPVSTAMMGNYTQKTIVGQFNNLGSAILDRFKTTGSDFTQSVNVASANAASLVGGLSSSAPAGTVRLTVQTASGIKVEIDLTSEGGQNSQLAVGVHSSGKLSEAERSALAKLADGFQHAIDGFSTQPPSVNLSGLMQFDPLVLSSVKFQFATTGDGQGNLSANFSTDSTSRILSTSGSLGTINLSVNLIDSALWGSDATRARSIASYLQQFDNANAKGHGSAAMMAMFKDAFAQMNSNYGTSSKQLYGAAYTPLLAQADHAMLTGLADFKASISDAPESPNPMRPGEVDDFSYQVSQSTIEEGDPFRGTISQHQQSHLTAAYHQALDKGNRLMLGQTTASQNYYYMQISDDADSTINVATERGKIVSASLDQSSSQSMRKQKYERGEISSDVITPTTRSRSRDMLALLRPLVQSGDAQRNTDAWQRELADMHGMVLLNADMI